MPRLLLCKLGAIGDVVMAIPAAYSQHLAGYEIHWICGQSVAPVLALYPWIHVVPIDDRALLKGSKLERLHVVLGVWRRLAKLHFDVIVTLYYDRRYRLLTLPFRARRKVFLTHHDRSTMLLPGRHHTDEFARILSGRKDSETPSQLAPVPIIGLPPNPLPRTSSKSRIVIVPAGARNLMRDDALRRWPVESYVELAGALLQRGCEVVLAGGPDDQWASPLFAQLPLTDVVGKLSLLESIALFDSASVVVTHDTGPLHLAGLTSCAIATIFGPTDPRGRLPQRHNCVALWGGEGFACRPCYDGRDFAPCDHNGCIRQITVPMVLAEIETLLDAIRDRRPLLPRVRTPKHTPIQITPAKTV